MTALLSISALIFGYLFASRCNRTKFIIGRSVDQRLYLDSAIMGARIIGRICSLIVIIKLIYHCCNFNEIYFFKSILYTLTNFIDEKPNMDNIILLIGIIFHGINYRFINFFFYQEDTFYELAIKENEFEKLIFKYSKNKKEDKTLLISLTNDKMYIGYVTDTFYPNGRYSLSVVPYYSGYRISETKELEFTTDYGHIHDDIDFREKHQQFKTAKKIEDSIAVVIKIESILSITPFSIEMYNKRFSKQKKKTTKK